jgi:hypothetical protein
MSESQQQQSDSTFAGSSFPYLADPPPPSPSASAAAVGDDNDDDDSDDYRNVWLRIWNNSSSPSQVSCRVAFDILWYCYSPANQVRTIYQTGSTDKCRKQRDDVKLCGKIKLGRFTEQEARVSRTTAAAPKRHQLQPVQPLPLNIAAHIPVVVLCCLMQHALRASRDHFVVKEPHVWNWRTEPPLQFRRQQQEGDTAGTAETPHQPSS